ncbi:MAG: sulfotransferase family protein [Phycisphaerales bacterium]
MSLPIPRSSNTLVVTGMHRSGTSLLASALEQAGLSIGDRLLGATPSNPKGHFEDLDFVEWHEAVFADHGRSVYDAHEHGPLKISPQRRREAQDLIDARQGRARWGFKDPRTCLFLDFWASSMPAANFLFIVRSEREVVESLRRRGHLELQRQFRGAGILMGLGFDPWRRAKARRWWRSYNAAILDFAQRHPDRCLVVELAMLPQQLPAAIAFIRHSWGLPLEDLELARVFEPRLLHGSTKGAPRRRWLPNGETRLMNGLRRFIAPFEPPG